MNIFDFSVLIIFLAACTVFGFYLKKQGVKYLRFFFMIGGFVIGLFVGPMYQIEVSKRMITTKKAYEIRMNRIAEEIEICEVENKKLKGSLHRAALLNQKNNLGALATILAAFL